jgi:hypothetical protein
MLLIPAAAVVVVGVAFGLAGSGLLSGLRPVGKAPATSLEWTTRPFVPGAHVVALTAIGDRVIATGSLNDEAAAWYSDDGGETWRPSTVDSTAARTGAALAGMPHEIGALAPIGDRLVGLDAYWFSSAQTRPGGGATHTGVWISDDQGSTWGWSPGIDGQAEQIAQSPAGLIAIGTADLTRNGEGRLAAAWSSVDGKSWKGLSLAGIDTGSAWTSVAFVGSRLMAVGSAPAPASSSGVPLSGVTPAAWLSTDGSTWTYIPLDPSLVGEAAAVVTSSNGFNVAGGAYSRGDPGEEQPRLWRTADGSALFIQPLEDDPSAVAEVARTIAINDLGALVAVRANVPASSTQDRLWFVPSNEPDHAREQGLGRQVAAIAALPDRFVLLSQCSADEHCDSPTVSIGIPGYERPQRSPSPAEIPVAGVRESVTRRNLAEARNGIAGGLLEPGWLPDGFAMVNADYSAEGNVISSVDLRYEGGGHYVHVWQTRASPEELGDKDPVANGSPLAGTQWNANPLPSEQVGRTGVVEYSTRLADGRTVSIDGDLDAGTMRRVLDSMYLHPQSATASASPSKEPSLQPTATAPPPSVANRLTWTRTTLPMPFKTDAHAFGGPGGGIAAMPTSGFIDFLSDTAAHTKVFRSADGLTWTEIGGVSGTEASGITGPVAFDGQRYVALGVESGGDAYGPQNNGAAWVSTDVSHWAKAPAQVSFGGASLSDIAADANGFVAIGTGQTGGVAVLTSSDGLQWTRVDDPNTFPPDVSEATAIDEMAGAFVIVGRTGDQPAVWTSRDGHEWVRVASLPESPNTVLQGLAPGPGGLVTLAIGPAPSDDPTGEGLRAVSPWTSSDGKSWRAMSRSPMLSSSGGTAIVHVGEVYLAIGFASNGQASVATSIDGASWQTEIIPDLGQTESLRLVSDGRRVILDEQGADGRSITLLGAPTSRAALTRSEAVAAAREFLSPGESAGVLGAEEGQFGHFEPDPNLKASPPPPDTLVWKVVFETGDGDQTRIVILDAHSGDLIEITAAVAN